jgi:hypothetical protein
LTTTCCGWCFFRDAGGGGFLRNVLFFRKAVATRRSWRRRRRSTSTSMSMSTSTSTQIFNYSEKPSGREELL